MAHIAEQPPTHEDDAIALGKVPAEIARKFGVRPHTSTVARWTLRGVGGHVLKTFSIGGRRFVRTADLNDFLTQLNSK